MLAKLLVPRGELIRSEAAAAVGVMAEQSGLFMAHFEHRREFALPEAWLPAGRPDLGHRPDWTYGVLPEAKYQGFRHDRLIGSFHPGHRAKWTAHELCHGLIGFAWKPDASPLFHALAARLAEAVPVALWYFLDEYGLNRCPDHQGGGPLYSAYCEACEEAATEGHGPTDEETLSAGRAFLEREIAAVEQSRDEGRVVPHRLATLELGSDGLAYAAAHRERLDSPAFADWIDRFGVLGGWSRSLDDLRARALDVFDAMTGGEPAAPLDGSRWTWTAQDLGWRLLELRESTDGDCAGQLTRIVDDLASAPTEAGVAACVEGYVDLANDWVVPTPGEFLAVGYPLPGGFGRSVGQLIEGITSGLPVTAELLGSTLPTVAESFAAEDEVTRVPVALRFLGWLIDQRAEPLLWQTAAYEAALAHAPQPDAEAATLGPGSTPDCVRRSRGLQVLWLDYDIAGFVAAVAAGEDVAPPAESKVRALLVHRMLGGDVQISALSDSVAEAMDSLEAGPVDIADLDLDDDTLITLLAQGLLCPVPADCD